MREVVDFNAGESQLILLDYSYKTGAVDMKMDGSIVEEKLYFKMLGLSFSSKLKWDSSSLLLKLSPK